LMVVATVEVAHASTTSTVMALAQTGAMVEVKSVIDVLTLFKLIIEV